MKAKRATTELSTHTARRIHAFVLILLFTGCSVTTLDPSPSTGAAIPIRWTGTIAFESRAMTTSGVSSGVELEPARYVEVVARRDDGTIVARTSTDDSGHFELWAPSDARQLGVQAVSVARGYHLGVYRDELGTEPYELSRPLRHTAAPLVIVAPDRGDQRMAGALHILDTAQRGIDTVRQWTDEPLPPLWLGWRPGAPHGTSYLGQWPRSSGRHAIWVGGGDIHHRDHADSDEHDEMIVLHELGHFVMDWLTSFSSAGGRHSTLVAMDPGFAWEEGRANWFAAVAARSPRFFDTAGMEPHGRLLVDVNIEGQDHTLRGDGSEFAVSEILWDLTDGGCGLNDKDNDGVALGPARVFQAMMAIDRQDGSFPSLSSFLRFVADEGLAKEEEIHELLATSNHPPELLPLHYASDWPRDIDLDRSVAGQLGSDRPALAQAGGIMWAFAHADLHPAQRDILANVLQHRQEGVDTYRIHVPEDTTLSFRLDVAGTGRSVDAQNLDLELRDTRAQLLDFSATDEETESFSYDTPAGWYIVNVRVGTPTSGARYELTIAQANVEQS